MIHSAPPMWTLHKAFFFEAAHHLPSHDGKCRRVHGHSWKGDVEIAGPVLITSGPKAGMLRDYHDMAAPVDGIVEEFLDHWDLNETLPLENPTSEEIARWLFNKLEPLIPGLVAVSIYETCTSKCRYQGTPV